MSFEKLSKEEANHIRLFIRNFIEKHRRHRWETILSMKPEKWSGISAYDCNQPEVSDWNTPVADTISKLGLDNYIDHEAFIFQIGHSADQGVYKSTLRNALLSEEPESECIISIIPGKLAISYGHSNEFRLCKK